MTIFFFQGKLNNVTRWIHKQLILANIQKMSSNPDPRLALSAINYFERYLFRCDISLERECYKLVIDLVVTGNRNVCGRCIYKYIYIHKTPLLAASIRQGVSNKRYFIIHDISPLPVLWALNLEYYTHGCFYLELSFSKSGGVHDSYTMFQCRLVGYFTSPGIDTR